MSFLSILDGPIEDMRDARAAFAALGARSGPKAMAQARPGGWTVGRIIEHLIESDVLYAKLLAHQCGAEFAPPAEQTPVRTAPPPWSGSMQRETPCWRCSMASTRARSTVWCWEQAYSPVSLLEHVASHEREHTRQIRELLPDAPGARSTRPTITPASARTTGDVEIRLRVRKTCRVSTRSTTTTSPTRRSPST